MPNVYPMRPLGADEDDADLLTYVARDPIGVEDEEADPADSTGWNEGAKWTGRVEGAFDLEHDLYGLHHTLKVARGLARVAWDTTNLVYVVQDGSYLQDAAGNILRGAAAFAASKPGGTGIVTLDLLGGIVLPSTLGRIAAFSAPSGSGGSNPRVVGPQGNHALNRYQTVRLSQVASTSQLVIHVYLNDTLVDANFTIGIHDR